MAELAAAGGEGVFQSVDVTNAAAVEAAVAEVMERWGRIDVLVNNAGILRDHQLIKWKDGQKLAEMSERDFDAVVSVNLKGVFLCTRAVALRMIEGAAGSSSTPPRSWGSTATSARPTTRPPRPV